MNWKQVDYRKWLGNKNILVAGLIFILVISFFISFVYAKVAEDKNGSLILSFPDARNEGHWIARRRVCKAVHSRRDGVEELVKQLGLGPNEEVMDQCYGIFPVGMKAESVLIRGNEVWIQLPNDFSRCEAENRYTVSNSVNVLKYNLKHNFNWVSGLTVTVDGIELLHWHETPEGKADAEVKAETPGSVEELR